MTSAMAGFSVTGSLCGSCRKGRNAQDLGTIFEFVQGRQDDRGEDGSPGGVGGEPYGVDHPSSVGFCVQ